MVLNYYNTDIETYRQLGSLIYLCVGELLRDIATVVNRVWAVLAVPALR